MNFYNWLNCWLKPENNPSSIIVYTCQDPIGRCFVVFSELGKMRYDYILVRGFTEWVL